MTTISLASIKTRVIRRNSIDSTYTDSIFLEDCSVIAQDIWSDIVYRQRGDKSWEIWYCDTVSLENEYTRPSVTSINVGADMIDSISITYDDSTYTNTTGKKYIPCRKATSEEIKDWDRLLEEQDSTNPIYFYSDDSIFIAPEVRSYQAGTSRIKLTGVRSIASGSWTTATTETDIKLPIFMFEVLFYGIMWKSAEHMGRDENTLTAKYNFYEQFKIKQIRKMDISTSESYDNTSLNSNVRYDDDINSIINQSWNKL